MKCLRHRSVDANGVCCVCGRGLCAECFLNGDSGGVFCSDDCAKTQSQREAFRSSVVTDYRANESSYRWASYAILAISILLIVFSTLCFSHRDYKLGVGSILTSVVLLLAAGVLKKISQRYQNTADALE